MAEGCKINLKTQSIRHKIPKTSTKTKHNCTSNYPYNIPRNADAIQLEYLIIPSNINLNDITDIEIEIGGCRIWKIPFLILQKDAILKNDKYIIKIDPQLLYQTDTEYEILLKPLFRRNFSVYLHSDTLFSYSLITNDIYHDESLQLFLKENVNKVTIYQYYEYKIDGQRNVIGSDGLTTNIYIKVNSKLLLYELYLDNHVFKRYDEDMMDCYNSLIYAEGWTKDHKNALYYVLKRNGLCDDVIYIINNYCNYSEYLYSFPILNSGLNMADIHVAIKLKTKDDRYDGYICTQTINDLCILNFGFGTGASTMY